MTDRTPAAAPHDLVEHLLAIARRQPDALAFSAPGRDPMTWKMLAQRIDAARAVLHSLGIERGDVVAGANVDRIASAAALAVLPVSCTFAALSPALTVDAYAELFSRMQAKAVFVPPDDTHPVVQAARRLDLAEIALVAEANGPAGAFDLELARATSSLEHGTRGPPWAHVCATSGSTGKPKIVPAAHRQIVVTSSALGAHLSLGSSDASAHLTPLHLGNGQRLACLNPLMSGGSVHVLPEADTEAFFRAIEDGTVTYSSLSFAILRECLRRLGTRRGLARGRLRFLRVASGKLEPGEFAQLESAFGVPAITGLGLAETGIVLLQPMPPAPRVPGSLGVPIVAEIRIADDNGHVVPDGEVGEIQVHGAPVFDGYIDDPALDAAAFVDGWFRTGDLGRRAADGEVHLVGRVKEVINRGGDKIAPLEVDAALHALPGVVDAAAFGVPHPRLGEEVVAAVVATDASSFDTDAALARLRAVLGARRAPRRIWLVDALPRNDAGKVLRRSLAAWVGFDPAADADAANVDDDGEASRFEAPLAAMWASALDRDEVARDADFGALGGDRTAAERLLDQVEAVFGVRLPVDAMDARLATVVDMARAIEDARAAADSG